MNLRNMRKKGTMNMASKQVQQDQRVWELSEDRVPWR